MRKMERLDRRKNIRENNGRIEDKNLHILDHSATITHIMLIILPVAIETRRCCDTLRLT